MSVKSETVNLSWTAGSNATSYNLYRSTTPGGEGATPYKTGLTDTTYPDYGTVGTTYYYKVASVNGSGTSAYSNETSATPQPPPAPTGLAATPGNAQVTLSWDGSSFSGYGAQPNLVLAGNYNIKRGTARGGPYAIVGTNSNGATGYVDKSLTNGTTYYYVITLVDGGGNESGPSNEAVATPGTPLPAAPVLSAVAGSGQVALSWSAVSGAASYNLYRVLGYGTSNYATTLIASQTGTAFTDTGLTNGTIYEYYVAAVSGAGQGIPSNTVVTKPGTYNGPTFSSITVAPALAIIKPGTTQQFTATANDQNGSPLSPQPGITWGPPGGAINGSGLYTAGQADTGDVVTATSGSISGRARVSVQAPAVTSITVSPSPASVPINGTQQFTAIAYDQYGGVLSPSPAFTWAVQSGGGTITSGGLYAAPSAPGSATVTASVAPSATNGPVSGSASVTVTPPSPVLTTITVSPGSANVQTGGVQQFTASGYDQNGLPLSPQPSFSWTVSGGGTIDANGLFTAGQSTGGPYTVTAASGTVQRSASVTVIVSTPSLLINAGGGSYPDSSGDTWAADEDYTGGGAITTGSAIAGTNDAMLYQSQRTGASFSYSLPVNNGSYVLSLLFAEIEGNTTGQRIFGVTANGHQVLTNYDIYADVGANTAVTKTFPVTITNGTLNLTFTGSTGAASVAALSLLPQGPTDLAAYATGSGKITLYWSGVPGATGYNIYRGTTAGGENYASPVNGTTPVTTLDTGPAVANVFMYSDTGGLTDGHQYFYTVEAIYPATHSGPSNEDGDTPTPTAIPWDTGNTAAIVSAIEQYDSNLPGLPYSLSYTSPRVMGPDGVIYQNGISNALPPDGNINPTTGAMTVSGQTTSAGRFVLEASANDLVGSNASSTVSPGGPGGGIRRVVSTLGPVNGGQPFDGVSGTYYLPTTQDTSNFLLNPYYGSAIDPGRIIDFPNLYVGLTTAHIKGVATPEIDCGIYFSTPITLPDGTHLPNRWHAFMRVADGRGNGNHTYNDNPLLDGLIPLRVIGDTYNYIDADSQIGNDVSLSFSVDLHNHIANLVVFGTDYAGLYYPKRYSSALSSLKLIGPITGLRMKREVSLDQNMPAGASNYVEFTDAATAAKYAHTPGYISNGSYMLNFTWQSGMLYQGGNSYNWTNDYYESFTKPLYTYQSPQRVTVSQQNNGEDETVSIRN